MRGVGRRGVDGSRPGDDTDDIPSSVMLIVFSVTMLPLAFSENIARAIYLATGNPLGLALTGSRVSSVFLIDLVLLVLVLLANKAARVRTARVIIRRHEMRTRYSRPAGSTFDRWQTARLVHFMSRERCVALGALLILAIDVFERMLGQGHSFWLDADISLWYAVALGILVVGLTRTVSWPTVPDSWSHGSRGRRGPVRAGGGRPWHRRLRRRKAPTRYANFLPAIPVLLGTLAAFVATNIWDWYLVDPGTISLQDPIGSSGDPCRGIIDQQYFAQVTQVIPLLLVAIGFEAAFFKDMLRQRVQRAVTEFAIIVLCLGEVLAISALTRSNKDCGSVLTSWHEYIAFVVTIEACFVAIATLAWALLQVPRE